MIKAFETLIRQAGAIALDKTLQTKVHIKGHADFVTDADLAVSDFLTQALPKLLPGSRILSEEAAHDTGLEGDIFIVDPIDGTTNLMYGMGLSAISAGLLHDGIPLMGAVFNPYTDEMFLAQKGKGATLNGKSIHVNADLQLSQALIGFEAGPATALKQEDFFKALYHLHANGRGLRLTGSAALDLAYVAAGRLSACVFHYLYPWDYAAGWLILCEAGGHFSDGFNMPPKLCGREEMLFASNKLLHELLIDAFD